MHKARKIHGYIYLEGNQKSTGFGLLGIISFQENYGYTLYMRGGIRSYIVGKIGFF